MVGACIGTDAHTVGIDAILNVKGIAGEKGLEYYRELRVVNLGAQVDVPELVERGPGRAGRRGPGRPGRHPARRAPAQHPGDVGGVPGGVPGRRRPLLVVGGPRFDELMAGELGVDRIFGRGTTPREVASYLVHALVPAGRRSTRERRHERRADGDAPPVRAVRHAHYAGNLVDGAYALGLFGDVATEVCIRTDGDEGLFAAYSDVSSRPRCGPATCSRSPRR